MYEIIKDKGNGVILDKTMYYDKLYEIIKDTSKCKILKGDVTITRLFTPFFDDNIYEEIYPVGSVPSRLHGNPKTQKVNSGEIPPLRPVASSIGAYNNKLAKFLDYMLT